MMQSLLLFAPACKATRCFFLFIILFQSGLLKASDTIPPTIVCPPNYSAILNIGSCDTLVFFNVTAFDNFPGVMLEQIAGHESGEAFHVGTTQNVFVATDTSGNTSSCSFSVHLDIIQSLVCADLVNVYVDATCIGILNVEQTLEPPLNLQCPDSLIILFGPSSAINQPVRPFIQTDIGKLYYFALKNRINGNACWGALRIYDTIAPAPVCTDIILPLNVPPALVTPIYLVDNLNIPAGAIQFEDNCGGPDTLFFQDQINIFSCNDPNNYTRVLSRTWTTSDINGNSGSCIQHINFQRDSNLVRFPADTIFPCTYTGATGVEQTGYPYTEVNGIRFSLSPQVPSGFFITYEDSLLPYQCAGSRLLKRFWSVTDVCNNTPPYDPDRTHTQLITFIDNNKPVITAPVKLTFTSNSGTCTDSITFPPIFLKDNCTAIDSVTLSWSTTDSTITVFEGQLAPSGNPGSMLFDTAGIFSGIPDFPVGLTSVVWTAWDGCGNSNTAITEVELYDGGAPTAVCKPQVTVYLNNVGHGEVQASELLAQWNDNCADTVAVRARRESAIGSFSAYLSFDCSSGGLSMPYILRVYDVSVAQVAPEGFAPGQYDTCTTMITVEDTSAFLCNPPADVVIFCGDYNPNLFTYGSFLFSCVTDSVSYDAAMNLFDTICNSGVISRKATGYRGNQTLTCEQQITINTAPNEYFIRFPRDTILQGCDGNLDFGAPEIVGTGCQIPEITFEDDVFFLVPDACYKLERTWKIKNHCTGTAPLTYVLNPHGLAGPVVSSSFAAAPWAPTVAPLVQSGTPINYATYWTPDGGGYEYRQAIKYNINTDPVMFCPATLQYVCDTTANDPLFWNQPVWTDPLGGNDKREAPADIRCYFKDDCLRPASFSDGWFELSLDLDNDGILDTKVAPGVPAIGGAVIFGNISSTVPDVNAEFDNRPLPANEKYKFYYETVYLDTIAYIRLIWYSQANPNVKILPRLPIGKHSIKWWISNYCGNESTCTYAFEVKECCPAPIVECTSDTISYTLTNGVALVPAVDFVTAVEENGCNVSYGISTDPVLNGPIQPGLVVDCHQPGILPVYIFAQNQDNQTATCAAHIEIIDTTTSGCNPVLTALGQIKAYNTNLGIANATARFISASAPDGNPLTTTDGGFYWESPDLLSGGYVVNPYKNDDPSNGLTAYDLIKISRHILNFEPLAFPYQMIAADANRSGTITTFDIVELRKLLLGTYDTLPACPSWRFIPSGYIFNNSTNNPFQPVFPESLPVTANGSYSFTGVKVGDLDYSVIPHFVIHETEEREWTPRFLTTIDQWIDKGETVAVTLIPEPGTAAIQGTLLFQNARITDIKPASDQSAEDFALQQDNRRLAFVSFEDAKPFTVDIKADKSGYLRDMMQLSGEITRALAFDTGGVEHPLEVNFTHRVETGGKSAFSIQVIPNPFVKSTELQFYQQNDGLTTVEVMDIQGRLISGGQSFRSAGWQKVSLDAALWPTGIYTARIISPDGTAQVKMISEGN